MVGSDLAGDVAGFSHAADDGGGRGLPMDEPDGGGESPSSQSIRPIRRRLRWSGVRRASSRALSGEILGEGAWFHAFHAMMMARYTQVRLADLERPLARPRPPWRLGGGGGALPAPPLPVLGLPSGRHADRPARPQSAPGCLPRRAARGFGVVFLMFSIGWNSPCPSSTP